MCGAFVLFAERKYLWEVIYKKYKYAIASTLLYAFLAKSNKVPPNNEWSSEDIFYHCFPFCLQILNFEQNLNKLDSGQQL